MKKEVNENKDQTKDNQTKVKKSSYSKKKRIKKIYLMGLHMFNQHSIIL